MTREQIEALAERATRMNTPHSGVVKRWKVTRSFVESNISGEAFAKEVPSWAISVGFCGYREKGWAANLRGDRIAGGQWGDELWLLKDGRFASNEYPFGYSAEAAIEKGRIAYENIRAIAHTKGTEDA